MNLISPNGFIQTIGFRHPVRISVIYKDMNQLTLLHNSVLLTNCTSLKKRQTKQHISLTTNKLLIHQRDFC